jgi:SAM-dependent methyltransferase
MTKQPKLILRESAVFDVSQDWMPGRFVEMGAGTGYMARHFLERGFYGVCHDLSADNRQRIRQNLALYGDRLSVVDELDVLADGSFDYLFAFEVLEHIENDVDVFCQWVEKLRSGGRVLISVPAHQRKFGRSDELVGHVRRYERDQLIDLFTQVKIKTERVINYGYPLTEITRRVSNWLVRNEQGYEGLSLEQRSICSAQVKPPVINKILALMGESMFRPFRFIQRGFYCCDLGDGLVLTGIKD